MVLIDGNMLADVVDAESGYRGVKGSIVRLYIKNFMTYRKAELFAGANINLVMGPNGTGKSTIVCAICLALAGRPKILGRAGSLREYIRHGARQAIIEIELYNPDGNERGRNYVIRRVITVTESASGTSSDWFYNGRGCRPKEVEDLTQSLNIQLDNLCQFLPQDRVQEFSKMDSVLLLKSTEMAIGNDELAAKHDALVEYNSSIKQLENSMKKAIENLQIEKQKNQRLEHEVEAFQQRQDLTKKIDEMYGKKLWILYQTALNHFHELKEEENNLKQQKEREERVIAPLKRAVDQFDNRIAKLRDQLNKLRSSIVSKTNAIARKFNTDRETADAACNEISVQVQQTEKAEAEKQKRVALLRVRLDATQLELNDYSNNEELLPHNLNNTIKSLNSTKMEVTRQIIEINELDEQDQIARNDVQRTIEGSKMELRNLENMKDARMKFVQSNCPDVYKVVQYFANEENRNRLKGPVYMPMILHVFVNDLKYGHIAEKHLNWTDMIAFYVEHKDDVFTVSDLASKIGARVSVIHHVCPTDFRKPAPTLSRELMTRYHFKKVLIDLLEAPDYYLSYIVRNNEPQSVPIGGGATDKLMVEIQNNTDLKAFYTEEYAYYIRKSHYTGDKFSSITHLSTAKIFTNKINAEEIDRLRETIRESEVTAKRYEESIQGRRSQLRKLEQEKTSIENQIKDFRNKADLRSKLQGRFDQLQRQIQSAEEDEVDLSALRADALEKSFAKRMKQLEGMELGEKSLAGIESSDGHLQATTKRQQVRLQEKLLSKQHQYEEAKSKVDEYQHKLRDLSTQVRAAADQCSKHKVEAQEKTKSDKPPDEVKYGTITEDEVDGELCSLKSRLTILAESNPNVMKAYQDRKANIERMEMSKEEKELEVASLKTKMEQTKTEWLEPLKELIERINVNFSGFFASMGCAGEISLDQGADENDFSKYGIKIKVKFRAKEQLTELDGWKQSGGERAITTALYVLSLQELTTVPFRVIDEINQGMDAKNEARFFNLLCSLANGDSTPQYFLLTPKMLPPVNYPDNVLFHFIFNGPHVHINPEEEEDDEDDDEYEEVQVANEDDDEEEEEIIRPSTSRARPRGSKK